MVITSDSLGVPCLLVRFLLADLLFDAVHRTTRCPIPTKAGQAAAGCRALPACPPANLIEIPVFSPRRPRTCRSPGPSHPSRRVASWSGVPKASHRNPQSHTTYRHLFTGRKRSVSANDPTKITLKRYSKLAGQTTPPKEAKNPFANYFIYLQHSEHPKKYEWPKIY